VVDHVAGVALLHFPKRDTQRICSAPDLLDGPTKADQPLVECLGEAAQDRPRIAFGIDGDEQRLDVLRGWTDLIERVDQDAKARRA